MPLIHTKPVTYPEVGYCIYCGGDGGADGLRTEHVIPESLGGRMKLPRSSCHACEKETHAFEGRIVSQVYGYTRATLGMRRGKGRKWPDTFPITSTKDGAEVTIDLPPDRSHTGMALVYMKELPPAMTGRPVEENAKCDIVGGSLQKDYWELVQQNTNQFGRVRLHTSYSPIEFLRFLYKIALADTVGKLGTSFRPFLTKELTSPDANRIFYHRFVGCDVENSFSNMRDLHTIDLLMSENVLVSRVALFAPYQLPAYTVAVGEVVDPKALDGKFHPPKATG